MSELLLKLTQTKLFAKLFLENYKKEKKPTPDYEKQKYALLYQVTREQVVQFKKNEDEK